MAAYIAKNDSAQSSGSFGCVVTSKHWCGLFSNVGKSNPRSFCLYSWVLWKCMTCFVAIIRPIDKWSWNSRITNKFGLFIYIWLWAILTTKFLLQHLVLSAYIYPNYLTLAHWSLSEKSEYLNFTYLIIRGVIIRGVFIRRWLFLLGSSMFNNEGFKINNILIWRFFT